MGMMVVSPLEVRNSLVSQILLKTLDGTGEKFQEDALKFGSLNGLVQDLCHGICQVQS